MPYGVFNDSLYCLMEAGVVFREEIRIYHSIPTRGQGMGVGLCINTIPINLSDVMAFAATQMSAKTLATPIKISVLFPDPNWNGPQPLIVSDLRFSYS